MSRTINKIRPNAANELWQPNYYEHVIRNDRARDSIREYIQLNPERWEMDEENPSGNGTDRLIVFLQALREIERRSPEGDAGVAATGEP